MTSYYGTLIDVQTLNIGTNISADTPIGSTSITVDDATMFDEDGGLVSINDNIYTYLSADIDAGVLTLDVGGLVADVVAGDAAETYPTAQIKRALVDLGIDDGDFEGVWATVPQSMVAGLPDGLRNPAFAETVLVDEPTPGELVLADATAAAANIPTDTIMDPSSDEPTQPQTVLTKVQSADYDEGNTGWALNDDVVQLPDVNVIGDLGADSLTADTITLGDDDLQGTLDDMPVGATSYDIATSGSHTGNFGTTEKLLFQYQGGAMLADHVYRIACAGHVTANNAGAPVDIFMRYTVDGTTPNLSSNSMRAFRVNMGATADAGFQFEKFYSPVSDVDNFKLCVSASTYRSGDMAFIYGTQAQRQFFIYTEDLGLYGAAAQAGALSQKSMGTGTFPSPTPAPPDDSPNPPQPDPVQSYKHTWWATWARSYDSDGGTRQGDDTTDLYQGYISGTHGNTRSLFGFDYADMQSRLAGATIDKVTITYRVKYAWGGAGIRVCLSSHTYGSKPGTWSGSNVNNDVADWGSQKAGVTYTHDLTGMGIGSGFRDGTIKGLGFGPGLSNSASTYYGRMYGNPSSSSRPRITINYRK